MNDATLSIWVGTYNAYNDGKLQGEWIEHPCSNDKLDKALERIADGIYDPEYMINDHESYELDNLEVNESDDIHALNEFMQEVQDLDDWEVKMFNRFLEHYNKEEALEKAKSNDGFFIETENYRELAERYVDEILGGVEELDKNTLEMYFDYESFGRSLRYNAEEFSDGFYFK